MQKQLKLDIEIDKEQLQKSLSSLVQMVVALGQFKVIKVRMQVFILSWSGADCLSIMDEVIYW